MLPPTICTTIEALMDKTLQLSLENEPVSELPPLPASLTDLDKSLAAGASLYHLVLQVKICNEYLTAAYKETRCIIEQTVVADHARHCSDYPTNTYTGNHN